MGKITIHADRKKQKWENPRTGTNIARKQGWVYKKKDFGNPGKGPEIIKIKREGRFGEGFFKKSKEEQHRMLSKDAKKYGEKSTQGAMQAIATFNKRTNPSLSREASSLRTWTAKAFEGKTKVI